MDFQKLKAIYPTAYFSRASHSDNQEICLPTKDGFIKIPKKDLTEKELDLIALFIEPDFKINKDKHPWYSILFEEQKDIIENYYRVLQIQVIGLSSFQQPIFLEELQKIFGNTIDLFFINENMLLLIEKQSKECLSIEDLEGIFLALEIDFDFSLRVFIGPFHSSESNLSTLFAEEQKIFYQYNSKYKCFDLSTIVVNYLAIENIQDSQLLLDLYTSFIGNSEIRNIISSLWKNLGNLSSTAKDLYMHRNTLLYKIDKFYTESMINLKDSNNLFLSYLLVSTFQA